jgi:hypothetical protein
MNNKDLLKQYVDTGLAIGRTQFDKLPDNLKVTYLRKRMIAANQDDDSSLSAYEILGVPDSYRSEMVVYLLNKMQEFFETSASLSDAGMNYDYGDVNPVVKKILKSSVWDSRIDNIIIDLSQDKKFMQYLNKKTLHEIMRNVVNPTRVFSAFGSLGEKFKKNKLRSLEKAVEDVVFSNNPKTVLDFLGKDILMGYFNKMEPSDKMYSLGHSKNPKELLPILGYETMDYIKQAIEGGQTNLVHHLLNNGRNPHDLEKIFDEYGIKHDITKYY